MNEHLEKIFSNNPGMEKKYNFSGSYLDYTSDLGLESKKTASTGNLTKLICDEVERILPGTVDLALLKDQLLEFPIISTADHHGLLNYKLLYNSNILLYKIVKQLKLPFVVVLATGDVPLKNTSYPRGFYYNNKKLNFFRKKDATTPVYLLDKKIDFDKLKGLESFILNYNKLDLTDEEKNFFETLFCEKLEIDKASKDYTCFSDQVTFLNYKLWDYYFDKSIREDLPKLLYIQSNKIINDAIISELEDEKSLVYRILFDKNVRSLYLNNFRNITGCWSENGGSEFFWGLTENNTLLSLKYSESENTLFNEKFVLHLDRDSVINALNSKSIRLTNFFHYIITTFLNGYITLGGFNQLEYLPEMQKAHSKCLRELGENKLADVFESRITDRIVCGLMPVSSENGMDLIWNYNSKNGGFNGNLDRGLAEEEMNQIRKMSLSDMVLQAAETMVENI